MQRGIVQALASLFTILWLAKYKKIWKFFLSFNLEIFQAVPVPIMKPLFHA